MELNPVNEPHFRPSKQLGPPAPSIAPIVASLFVIAVSAGLIAARADSPGQNSRPVVNVETGRLQGSVSDRVARFLGIPYAKPPVDSLRWRVPQPFPAWKGVRLATMMGASCLQVEAGSKLPWTEEFMVQGPVSEDCLFLNVWTPASLSSHRPVMVYVHGGGFQEGSGSVAIYDGAALARSGVVVVTINYRLGPLGFLAHPALDHEDTYPSGNYALFDQIAALGWIQRNIASFGGDARNVTLIGQSAGAASIAILMQTSISKGLFARAILESGPGVLPRSMYLRSRDQAESDGVEFAEHVGARSAEELRTLPLSAVTAWPTRELRGFVEDRRLIEPAADRHIPVIVGLVSGDVVFGPKKPTSLEGYRSYLRETYGIDAASVFSVYPANNDIEAQAAFRRLIESTLQMRVQSWATNSQSRSSAYVYFFDHPIPWPLHSEYGAFHTSEVPYVLRNLGKLDRPFTATDWAIMQSMSQCWVSFARTGNPNRGDLPHWPKATRGQALLMEFGEKITLRTPTNPALMHTLMSHESARDLPLDAPVENGRHKSLGLR